jgi:hypothetical protein
MGPFESNYRGTTVNSENFPRKGTKSSLEKLVRFTEIHFTGLVKLSITDKSIVCAKL